MYPSGSLSYSIPYVPTNRNSSKDGNNYVAYSLHFVGEVINESFESMTFVKIIATTTFLIL
jgi:hypothetical protein